MFAQLGTTGAKPAAAPAAAPHATGPKQPVALPIINTSNWFKLQQTFFGALYPILFYTSVVAFVLFLLLTFIHFAIYPIFSFSPEDDGIITIPTASDKQTAFTKTVARYDISANFVSIPDCSYTVSMDVYLSGDFQNTRAPRVLLYRAPAPATITSTDTAATTLTRYPDTNILIWLDPTKNDLVVSAVTAPEGSSSKRLESIVAIENVPLRKPFSLTTVFTDKFLEVYIDGALEKSVPIVNKPIAQSATSYFWPVPQFFQYNVKVSNINFWPRALSATAIRANGAATTDKSVFSPTQS